MVELTEYHHDPIVCRACGTQLDSVSDPYGTTNRPTTGAFTLCIVCGEVSVFEVAEDGTVTMREPNFVELEIFNREGKALIKAFMASRLKRGR